jgi:hypothetical protein
MKMERSAHDYLPLFGNFFRYYVIGHQNGSNIISKIHCFMSQSILYRLRSANRMTWTSETERPLLIPSNGLC